MYDFIILLNISVKISSEKCNTKKTSPTGQRCVRTVSLRILTKYVTYMEIKMETDEATE